jgi:8-oxo-dGTP diphosphatase
MRLKYRPSVFLVVYRKENRDLEYLLMHRILHWRGWEFPKGGAEKGETLRETVLRELGEETGLKPVKITDMKLSGKFDYSKQFQDRPGIKGQKWRLFAVEVKKSRIKTDCCEHDICKWFEFDRAYKILTWQSQKRCLKHVEQKIKR